MKNALECPLMVTTIRPYCIVDNFMFTLHFITLNPGRVNGQIALYCTQRVNQGPHLLSHTALATLSILYYIYWLSTTSSMSNRHMALLSMIYTSFQFITSLNCTLLHYITPNPLRKSLPNPVSSWIRIIEILWYLLQILLVDKYEQSGHNIGFARHIMVPTYNTSGR